MLPSKRGLAGFVFLRNGQKSMLQSVFTGKRMFFSSNDYVIVRVKFSNFTVKNGFFTSYFYDGYFEIVDNPVGKIFLDNSSFVVNSKAKYGVL